MEKKLEELKILLKDLILEVADLKDRVIALERTDAEECSPVVVGRDAVPGQESRDNLVSLYREGYHICPMAYGRPRESGCLFCINFLEKRF